MAFPRIVLELKCLRVPPAGLEPATYALGKRCSIHLSYEGHLSYEVHLSYEGQLSCEGLPNRVLVTVRVRSE